jgi:hypothetical protein
MSIDFFGGFCTGFALGMLFVVAIGMWSLRGRGER